ncbi:2-hydroxyacid dehydrogenase [Pectobacteriaceae bacterium CE90]|nr:2-hydroxyacid dehydrogenase [Pectobacteriaceae bacterium CE90]
METHQQELQPMSETMMKKTVLMARMLPPRLVQQLREHFHLIGPLTRLDGQDLPAGAESAEVLLTMSGIPTEKALVDALPGLRLVSCYGSGIEFVDSEYLKQKGIALTNAAGTNASSVAEFALGLILSSTRQILTSERFLRSGQWKGNSVERYPSVPGLEGHRLGIYGLGEIGLQIAQRAQAFNMEIGYHSRTQKVVSYRFLENLLQLAEWADVLVLAARGTTQNYHIVDTQVLNALGPQGHLVNIARGMLVDEAALCDALENRRIAGAALDVYEFEPEISTRLQSVENIILTPHVAANTHSAQDAQQQRMLDNTVAYFKGGRLIGRVC